jgi:hypothetical protein
MRVLAKLCMMQSLDIANLLVLLVPIMEAWVYL